MTMSARAIAACGFLSISLFLGGASAAGPAANALLQVAAVIVILWMVWRARAPFLPQEARPLAWIVLLFVALGLFSLVPLPVGLWTSLPFRDEVAAGFRMIGVTLPAIPLSLAPNTTVASLLSFLPPIAMFLLAVDLSSDERRQLALTLLGFAALSIIVGTFQLMGGPQSPLRPYAITNPNSPVGFFANANHQGTLILCALPFAGVLAARGATGRSRSRKTGSAIISLATALFIAIGAAISGSSAVYGLFLVAAFATLLIYFRDIGGRIGRGWSIGAAAILLLFVAFAIRGPLSTEQLSSSLAEDPTSRRVIATTTVEAIERSFPVGTGLGSFSTVYRRFQDPNVVTGTFVNHAHNDYLEIALETGGAGLLLIFAFVAWWLVRTVAVWRADGTGQATARAGSIIVLIVLLHSIVDYPLRTAAIAVVIAMGCALLVPVRSRRVAAPDQLKAKTNAAGLRHLEAA
jgi:O-antigen ligase